MLIFTANRLSKPISVGLSAVLSSWLAACSSGANSGATASSAPVNPCSVLTGADIQMALGAAPVGEGKRDNMGVVDSCTWSLPSGGDISVTFYNAVGAATTYAPTLSSRRARDKTYAPVGGLGSQAAFRDDSSPPAIAISRSVEVVQGSRHFDVHYVDSLGKTSAPSQDALISLAKTVLVHAR